MEIIINKNRLLANTIYHNIVTKEAITFFEETVALEQEHFH